LHKVSQAGVNVAEASAITSQTLLTGGSCKNYYNWAKGAGSGLLPGPMSTSTTGRA